MSSTKELLEYLEAHRLPDTILGAEYDTETSAKLGSYFKPFVTWYNDSAYIKGQKVVDFKEL